MESPQTHNNIEAISKNIEILNKSVIILLETEIEILKYQRMIYTVLKEKD